MATLNATLLRKILNLDGYVSLNEGGSLVLDGYVDLTDDEVALCEIIWGEEKAERE